MSGNPMLDAQIARAVQPQFNPMQAIQQMQRPAVQMPVQNPIFGGTIPMDFGIPQAAQIPAGYSNPLMNFQPSQQAIQPYRAAPGVGNALANLFMGGFNNQPTQPVGDVQGN